MSNLAYRAHLMEQSDNTLWVDTLIARQFKSLSALNGVDVGVLLKPFLVMTQDKYTIVIYLGDNTVSMFGLSRYIGGINFSCLTAGEILHYSSAQQDSVPVCFDFRLLDSGTDVKTIYLVVTKEIRASN